MDIQMPVMDGVEATHEIASYEEEENLVHTPIVALTANALKGDRERFIDEGLDDYLAKPIESSELLSILNKFLNRVTKPIFETPNVQKEENKVDTKKEENNEGITLLFEEKVILIAKKNPLEAQILSKVLSNLGYEIEIINKIGELNTKIQDTTYDILLIDMDLEKRYKDIIKKQHKSMSVILMTLRDVDEDSYDKTTIKEVLVGVMNIDKLKYIINKYRGG